MPERETRFRLAFHILNSHPKQMLGTLQHLRHLAIAQGRGFVAKGIVGRTELIIVHAVMDVQFVATSELSPA